MCIDTMVYKYNKHQYQKIVISIWQYNFYHYHISNFGNCNCNYVTTNKETMRSQILNARDMDITTYVYTYQNTYILVNILVVVLKVRAQSCLTLKKVVFQQKSLDLNNLDPLHNPCGTPSLLEHFCNSPCAKSLRALNGCESVRFLTEKAKNFASRIP